MRSGQRGIWPWIGLLLVVAAAAGSVIFVFSSPDRNSAGTLLQALVAVVMAAASGAAWLIRYSKPVRLPLERAADELAEQLRRQWERAATERKINYPAPIPLQWRWSSRPVSSPIEEVVTGPGGRRFMPLPGMPPVTGKNLQSGELKDLLKIYSGLDSGRLIILGGPGAGKSSAGIRLLLDALTYRAQTGSTASESERARIPVPVLTTLQGWNPTNETLIAWLASRLTRDYTLLRAPEYGRDVAVHLVERGYLALILDGLDEMPEAIRPVALRALDEQATFRLVVLTRSEELTATVHDTHLRGAAALEILPIDAHQVADYLVRCQISPLSRSWQRLVDHLRKCPDGVVAQALDTPLMLSLIRDTYGRNDRIDELIDESRFGTREAVEDHLLARVLPTAYDQRPGQPDLPYSLDQAQQWFRQLARRMNEEGTRDLAWWQIPRWTPLWPRILITVFLLSFAPALIFAFVTQLHLPVYVIEPRVRSVIYLSDTLGLAFIFGFWLLFVSRFGEGLSSHWEELQWSRSDRQMILLIALGIGLVSGVQYSFGYWLGLGHERAASSGTALLVGLVVAFVVGLGFILSGGPPQQWGRLQWSRAITPMKIMAGIIVGVVSGVVVGVGEGFVCGLSCGLVIGLAAGVGYGLVIVFNQGPSRGRKRLQWSKTVNPINLVIALIIGLVVGLGAGVLYGLVIVFNQGPSRGRKRLQWSKTVNPMDLVIALIIGLVVGLVFSVVYQYGLVVGLITGVLAGIFAGFLFGFSQPSTVAVAPLDPVSLWHRERQFGIFMGLGSGLAYGLIGAFMAKLMHPNYGLGYWLGYGLVQGPAVGLGVGLVTSLAWVTLLSSAQLYCRGEAPLRLVRFLDDAHTRQVLRTVGPVYQFRHARLQDQLAKT